MQVELRPIESVKPYPSNPRINDAAVDAVVNSIREFGWRQALVIDADGTIICGHTRYKAALKMGLKFVPVHVAADLTPGQVRALRVADNVTGEIAQWDLEILPLELAGIAEMGIDLDVLGFGEEELAALMSGGVMDGLTDPDDVPEPPDEAVTQPGDVWILGDHRLLCGDSGNAEHVDRLLDGANVHLVNTDPPYGVSVEPRSGNAIAAGLSSFENPDGPVKGAGRKLRAKDRPIQNDNITGEDFDRLLDGWFGNMSRVLLPGRSYYVWGGYSNLSSFPAALRRNGFHFAQAIVWDKEHPVMGRKDFLSCFELCFYGWKEGAAHKFYGPNNARDIWAVKKLSSQAMEHLTAKPCELALRAIQYSSLKGENVLDLFGGSGSTLIAAEQTGRKAYLMELDPLYADVIVDRYQRFTGKSAVLERTGESPIPMGEREEAMR